MFESVKRFRPKLTPEQAYQIVFVALYTFSFPGIAILNPDEVERFGFRSSGDHGKDYAINTATVTRPLSLDKAAEILADGYNIYMVRREFAIEAYNGLQSHLEHWVNYLDIFKMHADAQEPPLEELIKLEKLCAAIFSIARLQMRKEKNEHLFGASVDFSKVGVSAVLDVLNIKNVPTDKALPGVELFGTPTDVKTDGFPIRSSLLPFFERGLYGDITE